VAGNTWLRTVRPGQWKLRLRVIEISRSPAGRYMALRTNLAEIVLNMIGVSYRIVVARVTGITIRGDILISR
jgi:hypothetical protein